LEDHQGAAWRYTGNEIQESKREIQKWRIGIEIEEQLNGRLFERLNRL
jgi:hypothetical protein